MLALSLVLACGGHPTTDLTWHADIAPIVHENCMGCHGPGGIGAPVELGTFAQVQTVAGPMRASVANGTMPPWLAADGCNDYEGDFSLSDEERGDLLEWLDNGLPEGDAADAVVVEARESVPLERVDLRLEMTAPYTPTSAPDDYRCFVMEWPESEGRFVTGYDIEPGDLSVVHHVIPFLIPAADAQGYRDKDAAETGDGYTCYGAPSGSAIDLQELMWLGSWAPGGNAVNFPEDTGLYVEPGSIVVMQVHYYTTGEPRPAQSSLLLTLEDSVANWGFVQPWTDIGWVLGVGMEIGPQSTDVTHQFDWTNEPDEAYTIHSASMHMHTLGKTGRMWVDHADGRTTCLVDIPRWDFDWQRAYHLTEPVFVGPGDTVSTRCSWDNPTDELVQWGDGTGDEMCLGVTYLSGGD